METTRDFNETRYGDSVMVSTDFAQERIELVKHWLPRTGKLLEIGVWDGTIIRNYRPKFEGEIFGLDQSVSIMEKALPLLVEAKPCDLNAESIPWENDFFDIVVCGEVIEHLYDTDKLIQEVRRVLKPGGKAIFSTPNLSSFFNRIFLLLGYQPLYTEVSLKISNYGNPFRKSLNPAGHIRVFTYKALSDILNANGFSIIRKKAVPLAQSSILRKIDGFIGGIFPSLGSDLVFLAEK